MQTFATDDNHPASQNVLIDSNRCEDIDNICLIAEGPNSEAVMTARQQSVEGTRYARSRLATRFGEDSPIVDAYMQALTDVDAYAHSLAGFVETADYAAHVAAITKARLQATQTQTDFFAVARSTLAGSAANSTSDKGKGKPIRYSTPRM